jgi:type VI secretion system protein ImpE
MSANDLFKAGKLQDAVAAQTQEVKNRPADRNARLFLFELLAFAGDLERATRQLDVLKYDEMELESARLAYRRLLDAEAARRRLFREGLKPEFFVDPPEHVSLRLDAVNCLRDKRPDEAAKLLERANANSPTVKGQLNDKAFESLRDCDDLLAHVLEVMAHGQYYWVPLEQIEMVTAKAPKYPRDLLWLAARLEMPQSAGDVFLPALYHGTHEHADEQVKLGRGTDWLAAKDGPTLGAGLRTYLAGDDAVSILEWRELQISR